MDMQVVIILIRGSILKHNTFGHVIQCLSPEQGARILKRLLNWHSKQLHSGCDRLARLWPRVVRPRARCNATWKRSSCCKCSQNACHRTLRGLSNAASAAKSYPGQICLRAHSRFLRRDDCAPLLRLGWSLFRVGRQVVSPNTNR